MFNDDAAIGKILRDLSNLIAYCIDCSKQTSNENAKDLYFDARDWLEGVYHDIAISDWDEEDEDEEEED